MTTKQPIPVPTGRDLATWANKLVGYLRSLEAQLDVPGPKAVQLEAKQDRAKATTDGMIMFDRVKKAVAVAWEDAWHYIVTGFTWSSSSYKFTDSAGAEVAFALDRLSHVITSDVALAAATFATGATLTLTPGTWLVIGHLLVRIDANSAAPQITAQLNSSGIKASGQFNVQSTETVNVHRSISLSAIIIVPGPGTQICTLQGRCSSGSTAVIAANSSNPAATLGATQLNAVRLA